MKLLLDNNLSQKLARKLADLFPDSSHVALLALNKSSDTDVWNTARRQGYTLVSKDADFNELLIAKGFPPKVIWLRLGNCTTSEVEQALRKHHAEIIEFAQNDSAGLLEIY